MKPAEQARLAAAHADSLRREYERGRREAEEAVENCTDGLWEEEIGRCRAGKQRALDAIRALATRPPGADAKPATASPRAVHESHFSEPLNERLPCGHIGADCCNCATPSARPTCETCSGVGENTLFEPPRPCSDCNGTGRAP